MNKCAYLPCLLLAIACDNGTDPMAPATETPSLAVDRIVHQRTSTEGIIELTNCDETDVIPIRYRLIEHAMVQTNTGGHQHVNVQSLLTGEGIGEPSGLEYRVHQVEIFQIEGATTEDGAQVFTSASRLRVTAPGALDDLRATVLTHTTINANGELTAEVVKIEADCD